MTGKFNFQNDAVYVVRISSPSRSVESDFRLIGDFVRHLPVERHAHSVMGIAFERLPHITHEDGRPGLNIIHIQLKLAERFNVGLKILRRQRPSGEQGSYIAVHHARPAFHNNCVQPALDLEKARVLRLIRVAADTQLEAVLVSRETFPAQLEILRVQIQAHDWIVAPSLEFTVPIHLQKRADIPSDGRCHGLGNMVFQLITTAQRPVAA